MVRVAACLGIMVLLLLLGIAGAIMGRSARVSPPDDECGTARVSRSLVRDRWAPFARLEAEYELAQFLCEPAAPPRK
jgi:hypothetical protein